MSELRQKRRDAKRQQELVKLAAAEMARRKKRKTEPTMPMDFFDDVESLAVTPQAPEEYTFQDEYLIEEPSVDLLCKLTRPKQMLAQPPVTAKDPEEVPEIDCDTDYDDSTAYHSRLQRSADQLGEETKKAQEQREAINMPEGFYDDKDQEAAVLGVTAPSELLERRLDLEMKLFEDTITRVRAMESAAQVRNEPLEELDDPQEDLMHRLRQLQQQRSHIMPRPPAIPPPASLTPTCTDEVDFDDIFSVDWRRKHNS
ncbi:MAG: uncharacterized protein KVP18_002321 [Porospora cf. gigantea A]|uniref:uncharacterized protein n=1 Tax=Porospora cf. gigantea A TaxID=2853593 RepID=UPI00355A7ABA|nr:MAG: hypothetical protein KVP18_002321 [Porospora cf. gigantea A]